MTIDEPRTRIAPKLIDSLYVDAMLLADEARSYFDRQGRAERMTIDPILRVGFSCESLRVTTRLMHVIAWLLTQRAVDAGELSQAQARRPSRRLGDAPESDDAVLAKMPEQALALVRASSDLYARVRRLDDNADGAEDAASPARSLMSRLERSFSTGLDVRRG